MSEEDRLEDLLLTWEELREHGREPAPEELCRDCPELLNELTESIAALKQMAWLDDEPGEADRPSPGRPHARLEVAGKSQTTREGPPAADRGAGPHLCAAVPRSLGDYAVQECIGSGGMGQVYKAVHRHMQRTVALKIVRPDKVASAEAIARFHREVTASAKLDHPNIVTAHDAGREDGICYLVMEYVDGCNLAHHVHDRGPLPIDRAIDYVLQAARGLDYAHRQGITHRDVKPANLMLGRNGTVKVLDLGLARLREGDGPDRPDCPPDAEPRETDADAEPTQTGGVHGTIAYMAPEQRDNPKGADHRADVYSLGCTLYFLLTGTPPPGRSPGTPANGSEAVDVCEAVRRRRPEIPRAIETVIRKMTAAAPDGRHPTIAAVIKDLEAAAGLKRPALVRSPESRKRRLFVALAATLVLLPLVGWGVYEAHGWKRAMDLEDQLMDAPTEDVPRIAADLGPYRPWLDPRLRATYETAEANDDPRRQLHASLALLPVDPGQLEYLCERLLTAEADELPAIRSALAGYEAELRNRLWSALSEAGVESDRCIRAACVLAAYDPHNARWDQVGGVVVAELLREPCPDLTQWLDCLRPVRGHLVEPLADVFRLAGDDRSAARLAAAESLADFAADRPELLADLILDADERPFAVFFDALRARRGQAVTLLQAALEAPDPAEPAPRQREARRKANAAVALYRLEAPQRVWPLLKHTADPTARTYVIHRLGPFGADPDLLVRRLHQERDVSIRRAVIMSLGEFSDDRFAPSARDAPIATVLELYRTDPDPGIHGAAEWLLRRWGQDEEMEELKEELAAEGLRRDRGWYVNGQGQTLAILGPGEISAGPAPTEHDVQPGRLPTRRRIDHTFGIGTKEVTAAEFQRFLRDYPDVYHPGKDIHAAMPDCAQRYVYSRSAAAYCRWLSEREGVAADQMCYPTVEEILRGVRVADDYLQRTGYRLPTEKEWEYACRAGAATSRYYGDSVELLHHYAWYRGGRRRMRVGWLKPNDFGLFDTLGNTMEYCHDVAAEGASGGGLSAGDDRDRARFARFVFRGGSYRHDPELIRCDFRLTRRDGTRPVSLGFRVARTMPLPPKDLPK